MIKKLFPQFSLAHDPESRLGKTIHALKRLFAIFCFAFTWLAIFRDIKVRIGFLDAPSPLALDAYFYRDAFALALSLFAFEKMKEYDKRGANPDL